MREGARENEKGDSGGKPRPGRRRFSARVSSCLIASSLQLHLRQLTHTLTHRVMGGVGRLIVRMRNVLGSAESSANHRQHQQHLPRGDASTSNDGAKALTRLPHTLTHTQTHAMRDEAL